MVRELAEYVIIGHSERRHQLGETDEMVNRKVKAALAAGLRPIMCVGEKLEEREAGLTEQVLTWQTRSGLEGVDLPEGFIIAYEPVWAIGTGKTATPETAEDVHAFIRTLIDVPVLYGGSVKPDNAAELLAQPHVEGALVGGASLEIESFAAICEAAR